MIENTNAAGEEIKAEITDGEAAVEEQTAISEAAEDDAERSSIGADDDDGEEISDKAADPEFVKHAESVIEAVLFAAGYPVRYEKLAQVLEITPSQAKRFVEEYMNEYNSVDMSRGIMLLMFEDACQLCTKEEYSLHIREALGIRRGGNLSPSSIEVLAIIAYNEPVTRTYIDTVRGVDSSYAVTSLADKHLIEVCGRLDVPGRPLLYRTTDDFLRVFGMQSLSELPEITVSTDGSKQQVLPTLEYEIPDDDSQENLPDDIIRDTIPTDTVIENDEGEE